MAGKYKRIYLGAASTLLGLFVLLQIVGLQITSDGDKVCAGTLDDPCVSFITVRNPTAKSVYIYNYQNVSLEFSPEIESYKLYVKYYGKWRYTNFTMETRLGNIPKDRKYVFVFPRYSTKEFMLVGYKHSPGDKVKWGFGLPGDFLDPLWDSASLGSVDYEIYLDGVAQTRKYERGTIAQINISTNKTSEYCVEIEDKNVSCFSKFTIFDYVVLTEIYLFNDSVIYTNLSSSDHLSFFLDNRSDLDNFTMNITGYAVSTVYPTNMSIHFMKDGNTTESGGFRNESSIEQALVITTFEGSGGTYNNLTWDDDWSTHGILSDWTEDEGIFTAFIRHFENFSVPSSYQYFWVNLTVSGYFESSHDFIIDLLFYKGTSEGYTEIPGFVCSINKTDNTTCSVPFLVNQNDLVDNKLLIAYDTEWVNFTSAYLYWYINEVNISVINRSNRTLVQGDLLVQYPGRLVGQNLSIDKFYFENNNYRIFNLSFVEAGSKTIYVNVSSTTFLVNNFTFSISGFEVDSANVLNFFEYFNNSDDATNFVNGSGVGVYESFENTVFTNTSGRWVQSIDTGSYWDISGDGITTGNSDDYYYFDDNTGITCQTGNCDGRCPEGEICQAMTNIDEQDSDMRNVSWIQVSWSATCRTVRAAFTGVAVNRIIISDGTKIVVMRSNGCAGVSETKSITENVTMIRDNTGSNSWSVTSSEGTFPVDTSSLDSTKRWILRFNGECKFGYDASGSYIDCQSINSIFRVSMGGVFMEETGDFYEHNRSVTSDLLYTAPTNISAATIEAIAYIPLNTSITYYLSNDNGTTWKSSLSGERNVFSTVGNKLRWNVSMTSINKNLTPIVWSLNVKVVPSAVENITVDLGADFSDDYNYTAKLNQSNSPQLVTFNTFSGLNIYRNNFCAGNITCFMPIKISSKSGGVLEIKNFGFFQKVNPARINNSLFETVDFGVLNVSFVGGKLGFSDLGISFFGSKNLTIFVYVKGEKTSNATRIIEARYSKFNMSLPVNVSWWDFFASSGTELNITPVGQTATIPIWNVSSHAISDPIDFYVKTNESLDTCMNLSFGASPIKGGLTYQENVSGFSFSGNTIDGDEANAVDGNWSSLFGCTVQSCYYFFNYSKSRGVNSSIWTVNDRFGTFNLSVPNSCFSYYSDVLAFRNWHNKTSQTVNWSCYDGSWNNLRGLAEDTGRSGREEAIWWVSGFVFSNTSSQRVLYDLSVGESAGLWNYIDLSGCSGVYYLPWFHFSAICSECVVTSDFDQTNFLLE